MKNLHAFRNQRGFTLIETLVALAIFAIGIVACYTMQVNSSKTSGRANSISTSANWATYLVEELLAKPYDDKAWFNGTDKDNPGGLADIDDTNQPADTPDGEIHIQPNGKTNDTAGTNDLYSIYWNVVNDRPLVGIKQIRVTVLKNGGMNSGLLYTHDYFKSNENL